MWPMNLKIYIYKNSIIMNFHNKGKFPEKEGMKKKNVSEQEL